MLDLMALYTTQRKQYVCWSGQSNHRVDPQQESGSEMRNLALSRSFVTIGHILTADCRDDRTSRNISGGKMQLAICWSGSSHLLAPIEAKIQLFKSYWFPIYGCARSFQNSIRKLTVSFSDAFKPLINVPRYTSSSLAFAMNATDHINMVLLKFAYSLMSRLAASPNCIVTAIVNSDAYNHSPLMDKWESMLYV